MSKTFNHIIIVFAAVCSLHLFTACDKEIIPDKEKAVGSTPAVYLSVTRAQQTGVNSFNADIDDFEDRVHDLAMLVFDSSTGTKVCTFFDKNIPFTQKVKTFTVELTPGTRDFYFIANMPMTALESIADKAAMEAYIQQMNVFDTNLYVGATETKGFPMSRIYYNQSITEGGSLMNPIPFQPNGDNEVTLTRTVAKVEVSFTGNADNIQSVSFAHAYTQFRLGFTTGNTPNSGYHPVKTVAKKNDKYTYYVPEAAINTASLIWNQATPNTPINYFIIQTTGGETYNIPLVWNGDDSKENYLRFARGEEYPTNPQLPNYSVVRNQIYRYVITLNNIEILYNVQPWNEVSKSVYMGYGYNVEIDGNEVTISNTVKACVPHKVTLEPLGTTTINGGANAVSFTQTPQGASSTYTLANVPTSGDYLQLKYNDMPVRTFSK